MSEKLYRNAEGPLNDLPVMFRTISKKYELLARLARTSSLQIILDREIFRPGWQQRLGKIQRIQRAMGIPDEEFLHTKERRARGLPILNGRRPRK